MTRGVNVSARVAVAEGDGVTVGDGVDVSVGVCVGVAVGVSDGVEVLLGNGASVGVGIGGRDELRLTRTLFPQQFNVTRGFTDQCE